MGFKELISSYARYNYWANKTLTQWLKTLNPAVLSRETPSSFNSIILTIKHMNNAQDFWLGVISENTSHKPDDSLQSNATEAAIESLMTGSRQILNKIETFSEEDLIKKIPSADMTQSRYEFLLHVINHNTYHRGQIVTMVHSLNASNNIPPMDYEVFLWSKD